MAPPDLTWEVGDGAKVVAEVEGEEKAGEASWGARMVGWPGWRRGLGALREHQVGWQGRCQAW